jgi:predicted metal-binding protein
MVKKSLESLRKRALQLWAKDAKIIDVNTVKVAPWVRYKCRFGCDEFGRSLTCPPYSPTAKETQGILDCYKKAILIHTEKGAKIDISDIAVKLEKEAFFAGYYKALAMGAGPCRLCARCNIKGACRHAYQARPSMEACGIDVYQTVRLNGFQVETLDSYRCKANYFSLVLIA